jgi:hypothetical protein
LEKSALFDAALDRIMSELDDVEGGSAMSHTADDCPDPLGCTMHDSENAGSLSGDGAVKIEVSKMGLPSLDGGPEEGESKAEDGLSPEEAEELRKLLK